MSESMPLLLTESLDPVQRELTHQHIENCASCAAEWGAVKEAWEVMGDLPEVEVPAQIRENFLAAIGVPAEPRSNVVPFHRRPAFKWVAQAAAVALLVGGGYFAGHWNAPAVQTTPATIDSISMAQPVAARSLAIAETRVVDAGSIDPEIEGRPQIANVQFVDGDPSDNRIGVAFDITSRWTVSGSPKDKSMIRLLSYMLENETAIAPRSHALEYVRRTYSDPTHADPEIANALAKILRSDSHEGVRIRAVETLTTLPPAVAADTRHALIDALKSDPNPAVRIKAVEALANLARSGALLDPTMVETLRDKAAQSDENLYVRVKAAEALSSIKP